MYAALIDKLLTKLLNDLLWRIRKI